MNLDSVNLCTFWGLLCSVIPLTVAIAASVCSTTTAGNITLALTSVMVNVEPVIKYYFQNAVDENGMLTGRFEEAVVVTQNAYLIRDKFGDVMISSRLNFSAPRRVDEFTFTVTVLENLQNNDFTDNLNWKGNGSTIVFPLEESEWLIARILVHTTNLNKANSVRSLVLDTTTSEDVEPVPTLEIVYDMLKTAKENNTSPSPVSIGVITGSQGRLSLCQEDLSGGREYKSEILKLVDTVFIKPETCSVLQTVEQCYGQVTREVERCEESLRGVGDVANVGVVTSTVVFGEDYVARAKYWCLMSEYGRDSGRQVMITDDDDFVRKVAQGTLRVPETERVSDSKKFALFAGVGVGVSSAILTIVALALWLYCHRRNVRMRNMLLSSGLGAEEIAEFINGNDDVATGEDGDIWGSLPYCTELEISKEELFIDQEHLLGTGAYGVVYRGMVLATGAAVAVKTVKQGLTVDVSQGLRGLMSEIKILSYVGRHENIVNLEGAYTAELDKGIIYVITEFCERGSLEKYLRAMRSNNDIASEYTDLIDDSEVDNNQMDVLESKLTQFSAEICSGMEFLAEKKVIHGDLAARNVLVMQDLHAKISDFGLSRRLYEYTNYVKSNQEPLPWKWMAPEALRVLHFSEKSDVWAYGITLWEIWSLGTSPYPGLSWNPEFPKVLEQGLRLDRPDKCHLKMYEMLRTCWETNPERRPTFRELSAQISGYQRSMKYTSFTRR